MRSLVVLLILSVGGYSSFGQERDVSRALTWTTATLTLPKTHGNPDPEKISFDRIFFSKTDQGWATVKIGDYPPAFDGLARSIDGGMNWQLLPPLSGYRHVDSFFFLDANRGWASSNISAVDAAVLLHTSNGGETWERWSLLESLKVRALLDMQFEETGRGMAVGMVMPGQTGVILRTIDFGKTWTVEKATERTLYRLVTQKDTNYVLGDGVVFRGKNGQDWTVAYRKSDIGLIWGLDAPTEDTVVVNLYNGAIVRSEDEGRNWQVIELRPPHDELFLGPVRFADSRHGWTTGHHGVILATADGGETWGFETQLKSYFLRDIAVSSSKVFVVGDDAAIFWRGKPQP